MSTWMILVAVPIAVLAVLVELLDSAFADRDEPLWRAVLRQVTGS